MDFDLTANLPVQRSVEVDDLFPSVKYSLFDLILNNLRLILALERENEMWLNLRSNHIHAPKFALPKRPTDIKVM